MECEQSDSDIQQKLKQQFVELSTLEPNDDASEIIKNLNALLIASNYRQIREVSNELDLKPFFHKFNTIPSEALDDDVTSLYRMFIECLPLNEVLIKYFSSIIEGLHSSNPSIVDLWLKTVIKPLFTNEHLLKSVVESGININPLLVVLVRLLKSPSTSIYKSCHDALFVAASAFRQDFFSPTIQDELKKIQNYKGGSSKNGPDADTVTIRLYELIVDIAFSSEQMMGMIKITGFLTDWVKVFSTKLDEDPIVAMNMIKLVSDLANKPHGLKYLEESTQIVPAIAAKITSSNVSDDLFAGLMLPGCINFFVRLSDFNMNIFNEYPKVLDRIFEFIVPNGPPNEHTVLAIDSIAYICKSTEGKVLIAPRAPQVLTTLTRMINSGSTDQKREAINALNSIMDIPINDPDSQSSQLTENWYSNILRPNNCGLDRFRQIALEPFVELKVPALNFIRILAKSSWGQKEMSANETFMTYLLDPNTEHTSTSREAKYAIIQELTTSPFLRSSFSPQIQLKLRDYLKNGLVIQDVNVAFEST